MPGPLVHQGATVFCSHGGQAQPTTLDEHVSVSGMPIVTLASRYDIAGCPLDDPWVTGQALVGATRVFASGQPVVLNDSTSICPANGTPWLVVTTQMRVIGT